MEAWALVGALALVLANAFFVAIEFALVKVRVTQLEALVTEGRPGAVAALAMRKNLDTWLSASQVGITLASLALGWVGEPAFSHLIEPVVMKLAPQTESAQAIAKTVGLVLAFGISELDEADGLEAGVLAGLGFEARVEVAGVLAHLGRGVRERAEGDHEAGGVPGGARGEAVALEEHAVDAQVGEVVGDRGADDAAADDDDARVAGDDGSAHRGSALTRVRPEGERGAGPRRSTRLTSR